MNEVKIKVKRVSEEAITPKYQTSGSAGFDFHSVEMLEIEPGETKLINTGLIFEIPEGFELQIRPRSGNSLKTKLRVLLGTVDSDYRGLINIICENIGESKIIIDKGFRIAQGIIAPVFQGVFEEVDSVSETQRGQGGFGSTGIS